MVDTTACDIIISITKKTLKEGESGKVIIKKSLPPPKKYIDIMEYISGDNFNIENTRISYCGVCKRTTEQRIEERIIEYGKGESTNPKFGTHHWENQLCWWCNECDEHITDIALGHY